MGEEGKEEVKYVEYYMCNNSALIAAKGKKGERERKRNEFSIAGRVRAGSIDHDALKERFFEKPTF